MWFENKGFNKTKEGLLKEEHFIKMVSFLKKLVISQNKYSNKNNHKKYPKIIPVSLQPKQAHSFIKPFNHQ